MSIQRLPRSRCRLVNISCRSPNHTRQIRDREASFAWQNSQIRCLGGSIAIVAPRLQRSNSHRRWPVRQESQRVLLFHFGLITEFRLRLKTVARIGQSKPAVARATFLRNFFPDENFFERSARAFVSICTSPNATVRARSQREKGCCQCEPRSSIIGIGPPTVRPISRASHRALVRDNSSRAGLSPRLLRRLASHKLPAQGRRDDDETWT